jgi:hypothetical protein
MRFGMASAPRNAMHALEWWYYQRLVSGPSCSGTSELLRPAGFCCWPRSLLVLNPLTVPPTNYPAYRRSI